MTPHTVITAGLALELPSARPVASYLYEEE
jgi:hypothetical protein